MLPPNLNEIEDVLFDLSSKTIQKFSQKQNSEKFYGFGFDVDSSEGEVLLCFNTEEDFQKTAQYYIEKWNYTEEELQELKMNFGDWKYQGINYELDYIQDWYSWSKYKKEIMSYYDFLFDKYSIDETPVENDENVLFSTVDYSVALEKSQNFSKLFLESIVRVLIRLENEGILNLVNQEKEFIKLVVDHDEDIDKAIERIKSVRKNY